MFVIGQTYPVTEVPGPHSRKITNTIKFRLQIIAFKLLKKSPGERLKISRLMKYFPDQNELQMRQRLKVSFVLILHFTCMMTSGFKEFMEYHRRGPHQGFWRLKPGLIIPSDADMLKMVGPEQVVLSESMQVGQRHLQDAGYSQVTDVAEGDESNLSVEQQLAPWITTKNFLFATQAKAMLRLHGDGDPTGRGEAFSFIRISMKDIFVKAGEDYEQKMGNYFPPVLESKLISGHQPKRRAGQSLPIDTTLQNNSSFTSPKLSEFGRLNLTHSVGKMSRSGQQRTRLRMPRMSSKPRGNLQFAMTSYHIL